MIGLNLKVFFKPIHDYLSTRKRKLFAIFLNLIFPAIFLSYYIVGFFWLDIIPPCFSIRRSFERFINSQVDMTALLISFSMAALTIFISSDSETIEGLVSRETKDDRFHTLKKIDSEIKLNVFQSIFVRMVFSISIQTIYLLFVIFQTFFFEFFCDLVLAIFVFFDFALIIQIVFLVFISIREFYDVFFYRAPKGKS